MWTRICNPVFLSLLVLQWIATSSQSPRTFRLYCSECFLIKQNRKKIKITSYNNHNCLRFVHWKNIFMHHLNNFSSHTKEESQLNWMQRSFSILGSFFILSIFICMLLFANNHISLVYKIVREKKTQIKTKPKELFA